MIAKRILVGLALGSVLVFSGCWLFSPTPVANAGSDQTVAVGQVVSFDGSASQPSNGLSYRWDFGDGSAKSSLADPTHTYTTDGIYTVTLTVTNSNGVGDIATITVTVTPLADSYEPDDTYATANPIALGSSNAQVHTLSPAGDVDWVSFSAVSGHTYTVTTSTAGGLDPDTVVDVYDSDGTTLLGSDDDISGSNLFSQVSYTATTTGTQYVEIYGYDSTTVGSYIVEVDDNSGTGLDVTVY